MVSVQHVDENTINVSSWKHELVICYLPYDSTLCRNAPITESEYDQPTTSPTSHIQEGLTTLHLKKLRRIQHLKSFKMLMNVISNLSRAQTVGLWQGISQITISSSPLRWIRMQQSEPLCPTTASGGQSAKSAMTSFLRLSTTSHLLQCQMKMKKQQVQQELGRRSERPE